MFDYIGELRSTTLMQGRSCFTKSWILYLEVVVLALGAGVVDVVVVATGLLVGTFGPVASLLSPSL
jgi:hypothetical protein